MNKNTKAGLRIAMTILALLFLFSKAQAQEYTDEQIANAIYKAENSKEYPYGVKSINTRSNKEYARKICLNTIRNQRIRHAQHKCKSDFISCLGNRYCPPNAHKLNRYWVKNVKYWLNQSKK